MSFGRFKAQLMINNAAAEHGELAGQQLAESVCSAIESGSADSGNVVTFRDQAEFVARFVAELLSGTAWERWYFGAFRSYRQLDRSVALRDVLLDNREHLPQILRQLREDGWLEEVLALLDDAALARLWSEGLGGSRVDADSLAPLVAAAIRLADELQLWSGAAPDRDALVQRFLATAPHVNWKSRRSLTMGVVGVLRLLVFEGTLRPRAIPAATLQPCLEQFDWLETTTLHHELLTLLDEPAERPADSLRGDES